MSFNHLNDAETTEDVDFTHDWHAKYWDWPLQIHKPTPMGDMVKVKNGSTKFEVALDVKYFSPNEIGVKCRGNDLYVNCRHDEKEAINGRVSRELSRTYKLPPDIDVDSLSSRLTKEGILLIQANKLKTNASLQNGNSGSCNGFLPSSANPSSFPTTADSTAASSRCGTCFQSEHQHAVPAGNSAEAKVTQKA